jgi:hypothetical protein
VKNLRGKSFGGYLSNNTAITAAAAGPAPPLALTPLPLPLPLLLSTLKGIISNWSICQLTINPIFLIGLTLPPPPLLDHAALILAQRSEGMRDITCSFTCTSSSKAAQRSKQANMMATSLTNALTHQGAIKQRKSSERSTPSLAAYLHGPQDPKRILATFALRYCTSTTI